MRKPIIITLLVILGLTLVIWGFSYFVQPILSPQTNNVLYLFGLALLAAITLAGIPDLVDRFSSKKKAELDELKRLHNRKNMLQLVWNTWIEGVLKKSLYNEVLIELGMETKPDAVEHPWDMVMQMPDQEPKPIAPGTTMLELFEQSSGSLLILGEPGSGKTTMLLELARQAIERAKTDLIQPIPVVFNLSSWTPQQTLADWLVNELQEKYYVSPKIGLPWVENDELLLLLDGLDEVKADIREACVQAINDFRVDRNTHLAICSRRLEYEALTVLLKLHGAVLIQPLAEKQVDEYLKAAGADLTVVHQVLARHLEFHELVRTPLILSILVLAYRNASQDDLDAMEKAVDYLKHLFDVYIEQMFRRRSVDRRFRPERTKIWLAWIAHAMIERGQPLFYIESIQPGLLPFHISKHRLLFGLAGGLCIGLIAGQIVGQIGGQIIGLIIGLFVWLKLGAYDIKPTEKLNWSWQETQKSLSFLLSLGLFFGLIVGLIGGLGIGLDVGLRAGLIFGMIAGLTGGLRIGLRGYAVENRNTPGEGVRASTKNALIGGLSVGLSVGLIVGLSFGLNAGLVTGLSFVLSGGLVYGGGFLINHLYSYLLLYRSGHIPWNIIAFLDYCTDRIFLRRVGGGYMFIHRMLMEHFAAMADNKTQGAAHFDKAAKA